MVRASIDAKDVNCFLSVCAYARSVYRHYKVLFESGRTWETEYLKIAPLCFGDIARVLKEYIILQLCKLTDPERDHRGNENLSITFYTANCEAPAPPAFIEAAERLHAFGKKLKPARDKIISHVDRKTTQAGEPLGGAGNGEWNRFWLDLQTFGKVLSEKYLGQTIYINASGETDAEIIPKLLVSGLRTPIVFDTSAG